MAQQVLDRETEALYRAQARACAEELRLLDPACLTLEKLATDVRFGGFPASAAQRALCRAADGFSVVDLLTPEERIFHFGAENIEPTRPRTVVLRTGVRAGKSFLAACALLHSILTCSFRRPPLVGELPGPDGLVGVRKGELVRALIVAPLLRLSRSPLMHLVGTMLASKVLAPLLVKHGAESCVIRRPDGNEVTVELVAASSGGANLRSTWLAGVIFDEADFHDAEDAAVNLPDNYRAAVTRMLPGAQIWIPSSPWADEGPFHEMFCAAFGRPARALAFHSSTRAMNPTLDREDEAAERKRDPENAAREYDAVPLKSGSKLFFSGDAIDKCATRASRHLPPNGERHYAGVDLGFRKNSSALAIARGEAGKVSLAYFEELRPAPGAPLKPSEVCIGFGKKCQEYSADTMRGDLHGADEASERLAELSHPDVSYEEWVPTGDHQAEAFTTFRTLMQEEQLDLPNDARLLSQLRAVRSRPMPGGRIGVQLPKQGAAHGDLLMAVVLACTQVSVMAKGLGFVDMGDFDSDSRWGSGARGY